MKLAVQSLTDIFSSTVNRVEIFDYPGKKDVLTIILFPKKLRMFFTDSYFRFHLPPTLKELKDSVAIVRPCASRFISFTLNDMLTRIIACFFVCF